MTTPPTPPAPPAPPAPNPPAPTPPAPTPPAPTPPAPAPADDELTKLRAVLDDERKQRKAAEAKLDKLQQQGMTEQEQAIAAAKAEGKAEAAAEHARALAAAEFRAAAAGKIADPDAAISKLNLDALVKDGKPDTAAITALVGQLAAVPPPPGHIPPGPRQQPANGESDFFRATLQGR
jgi:hypothetical protein